MAKKLGKPVKTRLAAFTIVTPVGTEHEAATAARADHGAARNKNARGIGYRRTKVMTYQKPINPQRFDEPIYEQLRPKKKTGKTARLPKKRNQQRAVPKRSASK